MAIRSVVISSGHGSKIRGAAGPEPWGLDEVDEARRVVERMAEMFDSVGVGVAVFHDDTSTSQDQNLHTIVAAHNSHQRDLDISIHFNAYTVTSSPMGTECLYVTQEDLADEVAEAISGASGLIDRGPKYRGDLYFLNNTNKPAILVEVAFVDSSRDADLYRENFDAICEAIVEAISDREVAAVPPGELPPELPDPGPDPEPPVPRHPTLAKGDEGPEVAYLQEQLNSDFNAGLDVDGDFGSRTDSAVRGYQASRNLDVDGVVGPMTWFALEMDAPPYVPPGLPDPLSMPQVLAICDIAMNSEIASYSWDDRGRAPSGYIKGVALTFANVYRKLKLDHAPAREMAKACSTSDKDVFNEYSDEFDDAGMDNERSGPDALINLWALLLGLGMRESSGKHCCGRDQSADNYDSETCEAGAWQTSYNAHNCENTLDQTFSEYSAGAGSNNPQGFINAFAENVSCSMDDWENYGSGNGYQHQLMSKDRPAYAAEFAAITLRNLCNHYGPIIRHEAELKTEAADMLRAVADYVDRHVDDEAVA